MRAAGFDDGLDLPRSLMRVKLEALNFQASLVEALLLDERGDHDAAIEAMQLSLDQIDRSFIAAELYSTYVPTILAELASLQVMAGDAAGARATLERGFRLDPSHPGLWLARARLQYATGTAQLALASVNYALAIWAGADPEYDEYRNARALADEIALAVGEGRL